MPAPSRFRVGCVQMRCGTDPEANVERAVAGVREAAGRGAGIVCLPELFRTQYFCQTEDAGLFDLAEADSGPDQRPHGRAREGAAGGDRGLALRAPRRGRLPQHRRRARRRRPDGRPLSEDAHPGRPALLREVLLHAGRPRLPRLRHPRRQDRHARVLGSVVPGGRAPDGARRRRRPLLSDRDRLASEREGRARRARRSPRGRRCSARTRSPTACTSSP